MTCVGIDDEDERRKRSGLLATTSKLPAARDRMVWCMVGTAVYQVGLHSFIQAKNFSALKPGVQKIWLPTAIGASTPAIKPWMWNSGITCSSRSCCVSLSVALMLRADAHTFLWVSGTILGREVVPEVCRIKAMSSVCAIPPFAIGLPEYAAPLSVKLPAPFSGCGVNSRMEIPSFAATALAGVSLPLATTSAFAFRSPR